MEEISNIEDIMPKHSYIGSIATIFPLTNRFVYRKYSTLVMGDLLSALIWGKSRGPESLAQACHNAARWLMAMSSLAGAGSGAAIGGSGDVASWLQIKLRGKRFDRLNMLKSSV